jgi:hypothetical protein
MDDVSHEIIQRTFLDNVNLLPETPLKKLLQLVVADIFTFDKNINIAVGPLPCMNIGTEKADAPDIVPLKKKWRIRPQK